jgi:hypothetical protein
MTTRKDLPEEATEEPRILSPDELAERSTRRLEQGADLYTAEEGRHLGDPGNPLRIPGELSSKPQEEPTDQRPQRSAADEDDPEHEKVDDVDG